MCRIFSRQIYQALGTEDIRHRRVASMEILLRRLLALDYVLEHPGLAWLPTGSEKVRAVEALGIERRHLPLRVYRGAVGEARHHFRLMLPIAVGPDWAIFAYIDPGMSTRSPLHCWGRAHRQHNCDRRFRSTRRRKSPASSSSASTLSYSRNESMLAAPMAASAISTSRCPWPSSRTRPFSPASTPA